MKAWFIADEKSSEMPGVDVRTENILVIVIISPHLQSTNPY